MARQAALDAISQGLSISSYDQAKLLKGEVDVSLNMGDVRRLLLIEAAETGDVRSLTGRRLEMLGRAESVLTRLARLNGTTPIELLHQLREAAPISEDLFSAVAAGRAEAADALAKPGRTEQLAEMDAQDQQVAAAEQVQSAIPDPLLTKLAETISAFGSDSDVQPSVSVLTAAMGLSKAGRYAVASALLFDE
jgi:hypothetical protein